jgi:CPA1 family monovalent cation:H+ antiporter
MLELLPFLGLLLAALVVAVLAGRARVPYTVALVLLGLGVGLLSGRAPLPDLGPTVHALFAPGLFFDLLLPPIVFEAALHVDFALLRRRAPMVLFLVFVGVIFTTLFVGYVLGALAALPLVAALLVAAILSPTDPIAVVDLFRRLKVPAELSTIVESESLLNDAVGVIVFVVLLGVIGDTSISALGVALRFFWLVLGGAIIGLVAAAAVYALHDRLTDPVSRTALSVVAAYGSFLVATDLGTSGIIAAVLAGLAVGNWVVPRSEASEARTALFTFWSVVVYVANSLIFLAMGLLFGLSGLLGYLPLILLVFVVLTAGRAIFVYAHRPLAGAIVGKEAQLPTPWYHLLALSGVRGAIPVVLVLSLDVSSTSLASGTLRTVVATVLGVVLVSLLVNNLLAEWYAGRNFGPAPADGAVTPPA